MHCVKLHVRGTISANESSQSDFPVRRSHAVSQNLLKDDLIGFRTREAPSDNRAVGSGGQKKGPLVAALSRLAMLAAIRRASSLLSNLAADHRPGSSSKPEFATQSSERSSRRSVDSAVGVAHDKAGGLFLDGPRRREAARRHCFE
jgi:hypothetical protein